MFDAKRFLELIATRTTMMVWNAVNCDFLSLSSSVSEIRKRQALEKRITSRTMKMLQFYGKLQSDMSADVMQVCRKKALQKSGSWTSSGTGEVLREDLSVLGKEVLDVARGTKFAPVRATCYKVTISQINPEQRTEHLGPLFNTDLELANHLRLRHTENRVVFLDI